MGNLDSYQLYPETFDAEILVTSLSSPDDLRKKFLFCLDNNIRGELSRAVREAWPFESLLFIDKKNTGIKKFLLINSKTEIEEFLELASRLASGIKKNILMIAIPGWSSCRLKENRLFQKIINKIKDESGIEILLYTEEENE